MKTNVYARHPSLASRQHTKPNDSIKKGFDDSLQYKNYSK